MESKNSIINENNGVGYITYPNLAKLDFVRHASSVRKGGISKIPYLASMNLGFHTDDDAETVRENFRIFAKAVGIDVNNMVSSSQFHNANIRVATASDRGKGILKSADYEDVDALVTNEKNVALTVFGADCVPLLFADSKNKAVGAAHCGWRGTFKELAPLTVKKMKEIYNSNPKNIFVAIAPCIHCCCYEVDENLFTDFENKFPDIAQTDALRRENGKFYLDLPKINKQLLIKEGVPEENILISDLCSGCDPANLFSHRKSGGKRGIMASVIEIIK